ncbi:MAG: adenylate/guanylate cyclase domain-containing protein [Verrucomicrobiae bacterium]|nr:adenylate/guanylate cyclase domain-containing protein [Verrucomicrobiae bacterium]
MMETLRELLLEFSQADQADRRTEIQEQIWTQFGAERTVLIWDMSGFSLLTRRFGVVHYLSMVRRMQEITRPIVHENQGSLVKFEADNGFAVFPNPESGIHAALAMNAAFAVENAKYPDDFDIRISAGLDHGQILLIEGHDFFGDAVNVASKLGEDLAGPGEILITQTALNRVANDTSFASKPVNFSVSGLQLEAASITK